MQPQLFQLCEPPQHRKMVLDTSSAAPRLETQRWQELQGSQCRRLVGEMTECQGAEFHCVVIAGTKFQLQQLLAGPQVPGQVGGIAILLLYCQPSGLLRIPFVSLMPEFAD